MHQKYQMEMKEEDLPIVRHDGLPNRSENVPSFQQYECEKFLLNEKYGILKPRQDYLLTMGERPIVDLSSLPPSPSIGFSLVKTWPWTLLGSQLFLLQAIAVVV